MGSGASRSGRKGGEAAAKPSSAVQPTEAADPNAEWLKASPPLADLAPFKQQRSTIKDTAEKGLTLSQLQALGSLVQEVVAKFPMIDSFSKQRYTWETINLYGICTFFVMPLTKPFKCAFAELMATAPQVPLWFISHWWGTPFFQSLRMLALHHQTHGLEASAPYWMCTFANNQHKLEELGGGIPETPFVRVLQSEKCRGTIALMDKDATPFTRIWCILEAFQTTKIVEASKKKFCYEIGAYLPEGSFMRHGGSPTPTPSKEMAIIITEVVSNNGEASKLVNDGGYDNNFIDMFGWPAVPKVMCDQAVKVDCRNAKASQEQDKKDIMAYIGSDAKKDELNNAIRKPFVPFAMCFIVGLVGKPPIEEYNEVDAGTKKRFKELIDTFPAFISLPRGAGGQTPLHYAMKKKNMHWAAEMLIQAKADINAAAVDRDATPLIACLHRADFKGVELLVRAKVDPNKRGLDVEKHPEYPVHLATKCGDTKIFPLLLELKADVTLKAWDKTPLESIMSSIKTMGEYGQAPSHLQLQYIKTLGGDPPPESWWKDKKKGPQPAGPGSAGGPPML